MMRTYRAFPVPPRNPSFPASHCSLRHGRKMAAGVKRKISAMLFISPRFMARRGANRVAARSGNFSVTGV